MNRISVNSSNIVSIGYDEEQLVLEVEFKQNQIYQYLNVPSYVYSEILAASSHGKYLHAHIIGRYSELKVT